MTETQPPAVDLNPEPVKTSAAPPYAWLAWIGLIVLIIGIFSTAMYNQIQKQAIGPPLPVISSLPDFGFTDEKNTSFTLESMLGSIWVTDFIFTRCGGQCPLMTQNMRKVQTFVEKEKLGDIKLLSFTVDPDTDTPDRLAEYSRTFKADPARWTFLTGHRPDIYNLITGGFKLGIEENKDKPMEEQFIHSDRFVLVDHKGQIRGYFTPDEELEMKKLQAAIRRLSKEKGT